MMVTVLAFFLTLGVLIVVHEYGHYRVAVACCVKVLRFSVGFGRPLWSRTGRDGTQYVIAAIPLGGYVKMLDEREGDVAPSELGRAFNRKPVLQRMAIVAAGPLANLLMAFALLWAMLVVGFMIVFAFPAVIACTAYMAVILSAAVCRMKTGSPTAGSAWLEASPA